MDHWWKETTVYQIYPRSFNDTNNDGIGDLPGIIEKLDYLKETGIETLWISPFYCSPHRDFGYDISDYRNIDPDFGTMEDTERLIEEVHIRDMKIIFDMVLNHTSDEHEWFKESRSSRDNPKRDWYVWKDGCPGNKPPNNWQSQVTGSGWHYDETTDQWYWASFLPFQPDLNYRNPDVKEEMFNTLRFWLDKEIDGFRLDIIGSVYEDPDFRNNPLSHHFLPHEEGSEKLFRSTVMTQNHPDNYEFARELRHLTDEYSPKRILVGETFGSPEVLRNFCGEKTPDALDTVFMFKMLQIPFKAPEFRKIMMQMEIFFPDPWIPTLVFSNHDRKRYASQINNDPRKIKLKTFLQLTARGIPFFYNGEEIGMRQAKLAPQDSFDPVSFPFKKFPDPLFHWINTQTRGGVNRDECRTPMQWDNTPHAGFTHKKKTPWLPVNADFPGINVKSQQSDPDSIYNLHKKLLELRKGCEALKKGAIEFVEPGSLPNKNILAFIRSVANEELLVLLNFNHKKSILPQDWSQLKILFRTQKTTPENSGEILPWEGILLKLNLQQG